MLKKTLFFNDTHNLRIKCNQLILTHRKYKAYYI